MLKKKIPKLKSLRERTISADEINKTYTNVYIVNGSILMPLNYLDNQYIPVYVTLLRSTENVPIIIFGIDNSSLDEKTISKVYGLSKIGVRRLIREILSNIEHIRLIKTFISNENPMFNKSVQEIIKIKELGSQRVLYDSYNEVLDIEFIIREPYASTIVDLMSYLKTSDKEYSIYDRAIVNLCVKGSFMMKHEIS